MLAIYLNDDPGTCVPVDRGFEYLFNKAQFGCAGGGENHWMIEQLKRLNVGISDLCSLLNDPNGPVHRTVENREAFTQQGLLICLRLPI